MSGPPDPVAAAGGVSWLQPHVCFGGLISVVHWSSRLAAGQGTLQEAWAGGEVLPQMHSLALSREVQEGATAWRHAGGAEHGRAAAACMRVQLLPASGSGRAAP